MQIFTLYLFYLIPSWLNQASIYVFPSLGIQGWVLFFPARPQTACAMQCASVWIRIKWAPCEKDDKILTIAFPQNKPIVISSGLTVLVVLENEKHPLPVLLRSALKCARARQLKCDPSSLAWARRGYSTTIPVQSRQKQNRESSFELQSIIHKSTST